MVVGSNAACGNMLNVLKTSADITREEDMARAFDLVRPEFSASYSYVYLQYLLRVS